MTGGQEWTVVTVTFNSAPDLQRWWAQTDLGGAQWIVVDNASTDGSAELATSYGAEVLRLPVNVGFSRANNAGLRQARGRYVAFSNPDVRLDSSTFPRLAQVIDARGALVAPQLINPDGTEQPNARGLPFLVDKFANRGIRLPGSRLESYLLTIGNAPTAVEWVMGAAICGAREYFERTGGWDESFFLYYEDHAIGLQSWARGNGLYLVPDCRWVHGWRRETSRFHLRAWQHEFASAFRFYRRYPFLILPTRRLATRVLERRRGSRTRIAGSHG